MRIVVRVANSFTASKTPPFQALKGWCRIHVVGGTDAHPLPTFGVSVPMRASVATQRGAQRGRRLFWGYILPLWAAGGLFLISRQEQKANIPFVRMNKSER